MKRLAPYAFCSFLRVFLSARRWGPGPALLLLASLSTACGDAAQPGAGDGSGAGGSDLNLGDLSLDGGQSGHQLPGIDEQGKCRGLTGEDGCSGEVYEGESVPADLYIMFDQSGSMSTVVDEASGATRIDVVRAAVRAFLSDADSVGLGAGIGYFGQQPLGETSCSSEDYTAAAVEIGWLPENEGALLESLDAREPTGETPTGSAIRGACDHVAEFRSENPGRAPAILLVTDGEPKAPLSQATCSPTLGDAVDEAERCFADHGIRTYVLGVGPSLANLRLIAEAGGTSDAFLADTDNADDVLRAFRAVRGAAQLPCEMKIADAPATDPSGDSVDITVGYLDFGCNYVEVSQRLDKQDCESGGFFVDDPQSPQTITLCDATCDDLKSTGAQLYYSLGCPIQVVR